MKISKLVSPVLLVTISGACLLILAACGVPANSSLGHLQTMAKTCPQGATYAEYVGDDVSGSSQGKVVTAARDAALTAIVTQVAVCHGYLHVDAFTGSAAASTVVFDGALQAAGATQIARLRKVPALVTATTQKIEAGVASSTKSLSPDGSDIVSQFGMAAQFFGQISVASHVQLHVDLLTDGEQNVGISLNSRRLTSAEAAKLASQLPVAPLPSTVTVKVSGIGKNAGAAPATTYVEALTTFYDAYCKRTGAASCAAVTDYTS